MQADRTWEMNQNTIKYGQERLNISINIRVTALIMTISVRAIGDDPRLHPGWQGAHDPVAYLGPRSRRFFASMAQWRGDRE
jgi:hypothetical protein